MRGSPIIPPAKNATVNANLVAIRNKILAGTPPTK